MAEVTNTSNDTLNIPALGLVFDPGETKSVPDDDARTLPATFKVAGDPITPATPAAPPAPPAAAPAAPAPEPGGPQ